MGPGSMFEVPVKADGTKVCVSQMTRRTGVSDVPISNSGVRSCRNGFLFWFLIVMQVWRGSASGQETEQPVFRAGAATSNITPELGAEIVGGFLPFPATHVHDELHARCLVLDDGTVRLAFVVCDLLGMHRSVSVEARKRIEAETGIPAAHVLISGTHTHSAANAIWHPGMPREYSSDMELSPYQEFIVRRIVDGVRRAANLLRPAETAFGFVDVPEHVNVRRWFLKDGRMPPNPFGRIDKVKMNPGAGSADLIQPAGEPDPRVSFIAFREPNGPLISVLAAYSLHYVGGVGNGHISADYFGEFSEHLKRLQPDRDADPPFVAMMANGTSGDVNNINFRNPQPKKAVYEQIRYVARDVADRVYTAIQQVKWESGVKLAARYQELDIAWRSVPEDLLHWARETETKPKPEAGQVDLPLAYAGRVQRLASAKSGTKLPIQALRIGDVCIGTTPCETFAETGLEFRQRCAFDKSFLIELAHGYYGYLPTPRHFELGGYETWPGTNYLEPEASIRIMDALLKMAAELKSEAGTR